MTEREALYLLTVNGGRQTAQRAGMTEREALYLLTVNNEVYLTLLVRLGVRERTLYPMPLSDRL